MYYGAHAHTFVVLSLLLCLRVAVGWSVGGQVSLVVGLTDSEQLDDCKLLANATIHASMSSASLRCTGWRKGIIWTRSTSKMDAAHQLSWTIAVHAWTGRVVLMILGSPTHRRDGSRTAFVKAAQQERKDSVVPTKTKDRLGFHSFVSLRVVVAVVVVACCCCCRGACTVCTFSVCLFVCLFVRVVVVVVVVVGLVGLAVPCFALLCLQVRAMA